MARYLVVATGGAGGDLQPLIAAAEALRRRGHEISFVGDRSVQSVVGDLAADFSMLPAELDLGPRLAGAIREAMAATGGDLSAAGPIVERALAEWAREAAHSVAQLIERERPDAVVTSLFGVEVVDLARPPCPWAVINSTFYVGPHPPRPLQQDVGARAIPLISRYGSLLKSADLVLHATDQIFDFSFAGLPAKHHYVGPLGIWEPPSVRPAFLDEPGPPWVLVSISSQVQDDVPLAEAAVSALAERPVRVLVTLGPHGLNELSRIPGNVRVERSISHSAVLERGALLVSHAGHGSVMKALWHGKPMVLVPWGRDQPGVAARAQALGVARIVARDEVAGGALGDAVDEVLASDEMRVTAVSHSSRLRTTDPPAVAAGFLESLV